LICTLSVLLFSLIASLVNARVESNTLVLTSDSVSFFAAMDYLEGRGGKLHLAVYPSTIIGSIPSGKKELKNALINLPGVHGILNRKEAISSISGVPSGATPDTTIKDMV
jgi:hypothetical protein